MSRAFMNGTDTVVTAVVPEADGTEEGRARFLAAFEARLAAREARAVSGNRVTAEC